MPTVNPNSYIPLPDEADTFWCADFNADFAYRGLRALVHTYVVLRARQAAHASHKPKELYPDDFGDVPVDGLYLDGELINARMVPIWDQNANSGRGGFDNTLHLSLRDVEDATGERTLADPSDEIWVPLTENGDKLALYS